MPSASPLRPLALFVVGEPGVGKTTLVRALIAGRPLELVPSPKWTLAGEVALLGHYTGATFDGGDTVSSTNVDPELAYWERRLLDRPLSIFDGDRCSNDERKGRIAGNARALVLHLVAPETESARRREARRQSGDKAQDPSWVKGRKTKAANFAAKFDEGDRLTLDANAPTAALAAQVRAWLSTNGLELNEFVGEEAPKGLTLREPHEDSANSTEGRMEGRVEALVAGVDVEPDEEALLEALTETRHGNNDVRGSEPGERRPTLPVASYAAKRDRLYKLVVKANADLRLGIRSRGDALVEAVGGDETTVYPIEARKLGLFLQTALAYAGIDCPDKGTDDLASDTVPRSALKSYVEHILDMHAWPEIPVLAPVRPAVEIDDAIRDLYEALAERGPFQVKDVCDAAPMNKGAGLPGSVEAAKRLAAKSALRALPLAAYADAPLGKVFGETCDMDAPETERGGVWCRAGVVFRELERRRPVVGGKQLRLHSGANPKKYVVTRITGEPPRQPTSTTPTTATTASPSTSAPTTAAASQAAERAHRPAIGPTPAESGRVLEHGHAAGEHREPTATTQPIRAAHEKHGLAWTEERSVNGVRQIHLTGEGVLADDDVPPPRTFIGDESYALVLGGENVDVYKPNGQLLLALRHAVLRDEVVGTGWRALRHAARASKNRGAAAGTATAEGLGREPDKVFIHGATASYLTADGLRSNTRESNEVLSGIAGNYPATRRDPYCRQTAYTRENLTDFVLGGMPLIEAIDDQFRTVVPERYEAQRGFIEESGVRAKGWALGDTVFSTVTVNRNFRTAVHRDDGDFEAGFGNLTVLEGGAHRYAGGLTVFPRYRVAVDLRTGDFLGMDVHEAHANTELRPAVEGEDDWERISIVCYARMDMARCDTFAEETAKRDSWLANSYTSPSTRHEARVARESVQVAEPTGAPSAGSSPTYDAVLWPAFVAFSTEQLRSGDIDPAYAVLRHVHAADALSESMSIWRTMLYLLTYNIASAERLWTLVPEPGPLTSPGVRLTCGSERQKSFGGVRGLEHARRHIDDLLLKSGGDPARWLRGAAQAGGEDGWRNLRAEVEKVWGIGCWASYKLADLLAHVHGFAIRANDLGIGGGNPKAGPIFGLAKLTGVAAGACARDVGLQRRVFADARAAGVPFESLDQLETCLCNLGSLSKGAYYPGADIDEQQHILDGMDQKWWAARAASFPVEYLGERRVGAKLDVRTLKTTFLKTGEIIRSDGTIIYTGMKAGS